MEAGRINHDAFSAVKGTKRITEKEWNDLIAKLSRLEDRLKDLERKISEQNTSKEPRSKP